MTMEFKGFYGITELPPEPLMRAAGGAWAAFFAPHLKSRDVEP